MQGGERWPQAQATNPSARLRAARVMPHWITARGTAVPPPPPPPPNDPPSIEPEYEVIEFSGQQTYSNQPIIREKEMRDKEKKRCDLCGSSAPAIRCMQCIQRNFCYSCDEMYHRHPKRQSHIRKELEGGGLPPLPPKGEPQPPPVPPPRRNKRATPRPQHSPQPLSVPPSPQISQREPFTPKAGFMGSLKRMIGGRQLPIVPHGIDHQNQLPIHSSMMGFQDPMTNCNGFQDWTELQRGSRPGSFNTLNPPGFGQMMQAQSMAHLNCPSCHGHAMWNPWGGMPAAGTWQSSAFLNRCPPKQEWSDSDSDPGWHRERQRRFSTMSGRIPRSYGFDDTQSMRGGRRTDAESSSHKGSRRRDFDTMSSRGGSKQRDSDTISVRGDRKSELENSLSRSQRKFSDVQNRRYVDDRSVGRVKESDSSDKESDDDFMSRQSSRKIMSDVEEIPGIRKQFEPIISKQIKSEASFKGQNKRNEKLIESGRRISPINKNKYDSSTEETVNEKKHTRETESEIEEKTINGIEATDAEEEQLGPVPNTDWECKHCTFVNQGGTRVCAVCCKTTAKPKLHKTSSTTAPLTDDFKYKLNLEDKLPKEASPKNNELKVKRGTENQEHKRVLTSKGTSPPPQSISTQTYEEGGHKLKRATSLADYGDWRAPPRSASRQSLLSDTQSLPVTPPRSRSPEQRKVDINRRPSDQFSLRSLKRAGSQPPEYISSLVQKQVKQGLEMVKLLREAEEHQFSAEDLAVALVHCGDGDPINWLQENWRNMIDTVVTLGTNYGQERKENIVGTISATEAREALRAHDGNVWAAVTECVEQRQRKYAELLSRGNFSREDIVTVLTANHGNLEEAFKELNKNQLKPFLMRIWGPPQGADNDDGDITKLAHGELHGRGDLGEKNSEEVSVDLSVESNYDRIRNWLDHVNINNKSRFSQSMLQLNLTGSNRSELEWKSHTKYKYSSLSNKHQTSDVYRYLTNFYHANEKSLKIDNKKKFSSMQNLHTGMKFSSEIKYLDQQEKNSEQIYFSNIESTNDDLSNEIETVTIKLKPIIVEFSDEYTANSETNLQENAVNIQREVIVSNGESVIADTDINAKHSILTSKSNSEKSGFSSTDDSMKKLELSRCDSETDSESFESLQSEDHNVYQNITSEALEAESVSIKVYENLENTDQNSALSENNFDIIVNNSLSNLPLKDKEDKIKINHAANMALLDDQSSNLILTNLVNIQLPLSDVMTEKEVTEDATLGNISSKNENIKDPYGAIEMKSINMQELLTKVTGNVQSDEESEDSPDFVSGEMPPDKTEFIYNKETEVNIKNQNSNNHEYIEDDNIKNTSTISVNLALESEELEYLNSSGSKSCSEINDEGSNEFSEESEEYIKEKILFPIPPVAIKKDGSQISDANSDKDVSSILTDSERDIHATCKDNNSSVKNKNNDENNIFRSNQTELIDLLKKSLTKDDVVEKIVSTLFASVLQVSTESPNLHELGLFLKPVNDEKVSQDTEAVEKQPVILHGNVTGNSSHSDNEHTSNFKQEIITPTLILAKQEETPEGIYSEEENNLSENHVTNENISFESDEPKSILFKREARRLLAEGLVTTYDQAEVALQLKELNLDDDDGIILTAANECDSLESAIAFLQQECQLCAGKCTAKQMVAMLECEHRCCLDCASNYFTLQITERSINDCICPFCKEPDVLQLEEEKILTYFSNLDILLKGLIKENIHELFQRKLRDRTLMQDPNFKWCVKCSSGYIANPNQKRLMCPDCKAITCAKCMKPWEKEHEKMSCEEYKTYLEQNDPENLLVQHLDENGVTCPLCKSKYILAKGGCMHLTCPHCKHEFCSGCAKPFLMGKKCSVSEYCERLGLHSHHPRNCLFYLRDKEPEELEKLLEDNKINYKKEEESVDTKRCNVQLLKETPEGFMEGICGYTTVKSGLCRTHYVESLVAAIRNNRIDPVMLLDYGEALQELRRNGKDPPEKPTGMSEYNHRQICLKIIADEIPLD